MAAPTSLRFKFYIQPYVQPKESGYAHCALSIAEGFKELGITFYGNIDYWDPKGKGPVIEKAPDDFEHDVAIFADDFLMQHRQDIKTYLSGKVFNVLTDSSGFPWMREWTPTKTATDLQTVLNRPEFELFDLVLRSHSTEWFNYPSNSEPWAFGLTNRLIETALKFKEQPVVERVAMNFRILHDARKEFVGRLNPLLEGKLAVESQITEGLDTSQKEVVDPIELYYWQYSGRRHSNDYYKFISSSRFTYTFGGLVDFPYPGKPMKQQYHRYLRFIKTKLGVDRSASSDLIIYQHDSWRFWEVMLSNSIPLHMDLETWGLTLPEFPVNGEHYIGVKGFDVNSAADLMLNSNTETLQDISLKGRNWVLDNYSPKPVAERFIKVLNNRM